ncbi:phosphodiester glycosidase family protein [Streptomyces sp. BBFR2]|uniref:phosphodiester glycosidase family protein n=1 Tax=Streptomyces sp. BBFR2 TaxID=3372854 RepID=UPI0037DA556B
MRRRRGTLRVALTALAAWSILAVAGGPRAGAATTLTTAPAVRQAPGVTYTTFRVALARGTAHGHLLTVDLRTPRVSVDLLYPGTVAARAPVSALAAARGALAAVNGDFFHFVEVQHPGVPATGAPVGPAVAAGHALKAAVPAGQRFGPAPPPGTGAGDVLGIGYDRRARLDRLTLRGAAVTGRGTLPLTGLNQYALPVDGIGAYTSRWGSAARARAVCGTDTDRAAPCTARVREVTVRHGRVTAVADRPGGAVPPGGQVLLGREAGARRLAALRPGDPVRIGHRLTARGGVPLRCAVGGFAVLRGGLTVPGTDTVTPAVRTGAGIGNGGRTLYLLALDGTPGEPGLTLAELAAVLRGLGARDGVDLDGGGSSTLVTARRGGPVVVRNHPSGGAERPVANALGVFARG